MKRLTCEICGGADLIKQDNVFVCQSCGCKYSLEEARKMMVEGTVEVKGTVQIDNAAFVEKYLENARRAKQKEDWEEAEKYYNLVEQNSPDNIEAIFYSAYSKAIMSLVNDDLYKRQTVFKVLVNCISIIDDKYNTDHSEQNQVTLITIATDLGKLICSDFVYTEWRDELGFVAKTNKHETYDLFANILDAFKRTIANIKAVDDQHFVHEAAIILYTFGQKAAGGCWAKQLLKWVNAEKEELHCLSQRAICAYWNEHKEEKEKLESKKSELLAQIASLNATIESMSEVKKVKDIEEQLAIVKKQKEYLGLFKGKERKALQAQIDEYNEALPIAIAAQNAAIAPIQEELAALHKLVDEITQELTRDRF